MLKRIARPIITYLNKQFGNVHNHIGLIDAKISDSLVDFKPKPKYPITLSLAYDMIMRDETMAILLGGLHAQRVRSLPANTPTSEVEFSVFSQAGEDGIIQFLLAHIPNIPKTFIEFGVETYIESSTRFLLRHDFWRGLVLDGEEAFIEYIKRDKVAWTFDLTVVQAFITKDNLNDLFREAGFSGDLGILSIDIDGNDYWIWDAVTEVNPTMIICEYNATFGAKHAVTVPYKADFSRTKEHFSDLYYGASLPALCHLAEQKGYELVACNRMRHNAFFVRKDSGHGLPVLPLTDDLVNAPYRNSRNEAGELTFLRGDDRLKVMQDCLVYDIITAKTQTIREQFGLSKD